MKFSIRIIVAISTIILSIPPFLFFLMGLMWAGVSPDYRYPLDFIISWIPFLVIDLISLMCGIAALFVKSKIWSVIGIIAVALCWIIMYLVSYTSLDFWFL